jgi:hypothetical protein
MTVTIEDVEALDSKSWQSLTDEKKQQLLEDARRESRTLYTGQVARMPTLEGDKDIFVKNLAAHKWELAEGGESQSESQTGGSTSYQQSQADDYLTLTRFGETAKRHVRDEQSISIVRTY